LFEKSLILLLICVFINDNIPNTKLEGYHALIVENRVSNIESYFLSTIILTKNQANKKSYFLAFFSSFHVFAILAQAFLLDSFCFSEASLLLSLDCQTHSDDSISGLKSSNHIVFL
jgi:hypothetical protein